MIKSEDLTYIGRFGKVHGYKGEINLTFAQFQDDRYLKYKLPLIIIIDGCYVPFFIDSYRTRGKDMSWLVTVAGPGEIPLHLGQVSELQNEDIYGIRDKVMEMYPDFIPDEEFDLTGYQLYDENYGYVGRIIEFDDSTENMLIEVELKDDRVVTLPMNFDFIISETYGEDGADPEIKTIYPDGLLESLLDIEYDSQIPEEDV